MCQRYAPERTKVFFWNHIFDVILQRHALRDWLHICDAMRPQTFMCWATNLPIKLTVGLLFQDKANGKHLGTWSPGFPELQVQENSPLHGTKVQCCLLFIAQGLENILEDQKTNLNPEDDSLHRKLGDAVLRVNMLAVCVKENLGGECSPKPSPPKMPKHAFERKQWSHTLLKTARDYLGWLERKIGLQITRVKGKNKIKHTEATCERCLEGSGYPF